MSKCVVRKGRKESESVLTLSNSIQRRFCPVCLSSVGNRLLNDIKQRKNIIQPNRPTKFNIIHIVALLLDFKYRKLATHIKTNYNEIFTFAHYTFAIRLLLFIAFASIVSRQFLWQSKSKLIWWSRTTCHRFHWNIGQSFVWKLSSRFDAIADNMFEWCIYWRFFGCTK